MKIFNRMTRQQFIDGRLIPTNAFYGRLVLKYTDKIKIGNRPVFDKNGYPIFRQDGTQVTRNVYKRVEKACEVTYSVEDLFPVSIGDTTCFKAWYKVGRDSKWRNESVLNHNALETELNNFIVRKVQEYCAQNKCGLFDLCMAVKRPHLNRTRQCAQSAAGRREVQTKFVYSGGEGQILRARHAINENVRFNADGSSIKGVIATHKDAFGAKQVYDPAKASAEDARAPKFGYTAENVRVVFSKKNMAHAQAIYNGNGHFVAGNGAELERAQNAGKDLHEVAAAEYWDKPRKISKPELKGKEPTFRKFVKTPMGIKGFYNEKEYNDYMAAMAVVNR